MPASDVREIRTVTVLFSDLSGFTALSERLDPEEVRDIVDELFGRFRPLIESQGGTIDKFIGDAVMAVFGAPAAHEDDPVRAVRAGLAMQRELAAFNGEKGLDLRMRVGINTGPIVWGTIGGARATATGDAVAISQRLESSARPGTVRVSATTARAARRKFRFLKRDAVEVKGHPEAVESFEVEEARSETGVAPPESPFAGREAELARLAGLWKAGEGAFVVIEGEAGAGKTRLAAELRRAVRGRSPGAWVATGRPAEGPLSPVAEALRSAAGAPPSEPGALSRYAAGLAATLEREEPDPVARENTAHLLLLSMGVAAPGERVSSLGPAQLESEIRAAWRRWLAARAPALLVIEDLHAADEATIDLLESLPAAAAGRPLMVVATARPGGRRPAGFERLDLGDLPRADIARIAASVLAAPLSPALEEFVANAAGGNPYYAEELCRYLLEALLVEGHPTALRPGPTRVPAGLEGLLVARIDGLDAEHRETLKGASVLGRVFWAGLLGLALERDAAPGVEEARQRDMVRPEEASQMPGDAEFSFRHALLRDAAYSLLPKKDRVRLHAAVAALLESRGKPSDRRLLSMAARHREAAGQMREAGEDWHDVAQSAFVAALPSESIAAARESVRCRDSAQARMALAQACLLTGRFAECEAQLQAVESAPESLPQAASSLPLILAQVRRRQGQFAAALELIERAIGAGPAGGFQVTSLGVKSDILESLGRYAEAIQTLSAAEASIPALPEPVAREFKAGVQLERSSVLLNMGDLKGAYEEGRLARDIFRVAGRTGGVANATVAMGNALWKMGRFGEALAEMESALRIFRETGSRSGEAVCLNNIGLLRNDTGDTAGAMQAWTQALVLQKTLNIPKSEANVLNNLAMGESEMGRIEESLRLAREGLAIRERIGDRAGIASSHARIGKTLSEAGDFPGARQALETALALRRELGARQGVGSTLSDLGEVELKAGRAARAVEILTEAVSVCRECGAFAIAGDASRNLAAALRVEGRTGEAEASDRDAEEFRRRLAT